MRIITALLTLSFAVPALADNTTPNTPAQWLARMSDFSQNSLPARDPQAFIGFLDAFTEPSFQVKRIDKVTEPALWGKVISTASSPGAVENMQAVATPQTAMNWATAMMDPRFYQAMMAVLSDPGKQMRWAAAPMDPASYQPIEKLAAPAIYDRWGQAATRAVEPNQAGAPAFESFFPFSMMPR